MCYTTGLRIPSSGIYKVIHHLHRASHEVTLLVGDVFPRCAKCGDAVRFELLRSAPDLQSRDFAIHLYEIPDMDDNLSPTGPLE